MLPATGMGDMHAIDHEKILGDTTGMHLRGIKNVCATSLLCCERLEEQMP